MSVEGCPHGPGIAALCRECALEDRSTELLGRLESRIETAEAELEKLPPEERAAAMESANRRVVTQIVALEAELRERRKDPTRWGHALDNRTERWQGLHRTREDAIAEGRIEHGGSGFWIARGIKCDPAQFMPDADDLVQIMADNAGDNAGEIAEDWPDGPTKEGADELTELLAAWARKHLPCEFWIADGHEEEIPHIADVVVCERCEDTHTMEAWDGSGQQWPCTGCPRPCPKCASDDGRGAYCAATPCSCECHR